HEHINVNPDVVARRDLALAAARGVGGEDLLSHRHGTGGGTNSGHAAALLGGEGAKRGREPATTSPPEEGRGKSSIVALPRRRGHAGAGDPGKSLSLPSLGSTGSGKVRRTPA